MIIKVLEPVCYATTFTIPASDGAESRSVWISAPLSRFSPEFHDFPKFLPGGLEEAVRPDGQLFPHKLPTACPNLSLGSEAAAGVAAAVARRGGSRVQLRSAGNSVLRLASRKAKF